MKRALQVEGLRGPRPSDRIPRPGRKLDVLNVECDKCSRRGRYRLYRLIERYGAKLFDRSNKITADCPRKQARNLHD